MDMDKLDLSAETLLEGVRWSPHHDINADLFLHLADQLSSMERYEEAQAVIEAVRISSQQIHSLGVYGTVQNAADILECVINTRRMHYRNHCKIAKKLLMDLLLLQLDDYIDIFSKNDSNDQELNESIIAIVRLLKSQLSEQNDGLLGSITDKVYSFCSRMTEIKSNKDLRLSKVISKIISLYGKHFICADHNKKLHFPKVFVKLQDVPFHIDEAARLSLYAIHQESLADLLKKVSVGKLGQLEGNFGQLMFSQAVMFFGKQASKNLSLFAELCNSLAYNRIETGLLTERYAFVDSGCTLVTMSFLVEASDRDTSYHREFCEKLAQYCDTYGWLHYRNAFTSYQEKISSQDNEKRDLPSPIERTDASLFKSEEFLKQGVRYDPKRAIIHYHLSRLYFIRVELIWQSDPGAISRDMIGISAQFIDEHLNNSLREWRNARQFDRFGRLHSRLSLLHNRINRYKKVWDKRQLMGIAGGLEQSFQPGSGDMTRTI